MMFIHYIQFLIFSACIHIFSLIAYVIYYSDFLNTVYLQDFGNEYDFIIVGSGTAGSLIAHRLATETNYTFIILEAGGRGHSLLEIPVIGPFLQSSVYNWHFETISQDNACLAMTDRKCKLHQGKIVGGSSKMNNMVYVRGNISHYVDWFNGIYTEDYIRKQFEYLEKEIIYLDNIQYESDLSNNVLQAAKELGYDYLGLEFKLGFSKSVLSQRNGKRWSNSDNLDTKKYVLSNALVEKLIFDGNTVRGVSFILGNKMKKEIYAKRGVIVSAGTYNSPKILQLSGIGPENSLKILGIPVKKDLPVGRNLQDHVSTGLDLVYFNKSVSVQAMDMLNPYDAMQYFLKGKGALTAPGCEVLGFISTQNKTTADIEFMVLPAGAATDRGSMLKNNFGLNDLVWNNYFSLSFDKYVITILPILLHPKSRGSVMINSKDAKAPPLINPKFFSYKEDIKVLINGIKKLIELVETDTMKDIGGQLNLNKFPGCEEFELFSDRYLECYVKHLTLTVFHPVGTCAMGLPESKNSVVDTSFKVLGFNKLFVVDASVLPTLPSGNTNAAVSMMASIFFDTHFKSKTINEVLFCSKYDRFLEYINNFCIRSYDGYSWNSYSMRMFID